MGRRRKGISVYEPRSHGKRYRYRVRDGVTGASRYPSFATEEEAWRDYREALKAAAEYQAPTVGELIDLYRVAKADNRRSSVRTTMYRLRAFFHQPGLMITRVSSRKVEELYKRRLSKAGDTHLNEFNEAKSFLKWCVKQGHLRSNPAIGVETRGKRQKGKAQLRDREAARFCRHALADSESGIDGAFAAAACLVLGLRQSEITERVVRDIDTLTWKLYIDKTKTEAGQRSVRIPEFMREHFSKRIDGKEPYEPLLPARSGTGFHRKEWVNKHTHRICKAAGVHDVCAQALRGTHATLAVEANETSSVVAASLGHGNSRVTEEHYIARGTIERVQEQHVAEFFSANQAEEV